MQTAVKQELKKANAAAAVTQMSVAGMGGEEQGAAARGSPVNDGTGTAARKSEKVRHAMKSLCVVSTEMAHLRARVKQTGRGGAQGLSRAEYRMGFAVPMGVGSARRDQRG